MRTVRAGTLVPGVVAIVLIGCVRSPATVPAPSPQPRSLRPIEVNELHNVFQIDEQLYSGSGPEGDAGLAALQRLGIKVVLSVDGARPDVERAGKYGLKYAHVPVGYNGISRSQALQIARVVNAAEGPVYLHCHHGKHRGPTAAAIARLCRDDHCAVEDALAVLNAAGTDPRYAGLFRSVREFSRPSADELTRTPLPPEVAEVAGLTQAMVAIDHAWDNLKLARGAGWKAPPSHPDIDPAHEALQLLEGYRELRRLPEVASRPDEFRAWATEGQTSAVELERLLRAARGTEKVETTAVEQAYRRAGGLCVQCHAKYRDTP